MDIYFDYNSPTSVDTNEKAIDNAIRNILLTRLGSLPGKPDFGSRLLEQVFDLMDGKLSQDLLSSTILQALIKWEPRINIHDVKVLLLPEYNRVIVDIYYSFELVGKNISTKTSITISDI